MYRKLALLLVLFGYSVTHAGDAYVITPTFVHAGPNATPENRICRLHKGTKVAVKGNVGDLSIIKYSGYDLTLTGYLPKESITDQAPEERTPPEETTPTHYVKEATKLMKSGRLSGTLAEITGYGPGVTILAAEGGFRRVAYCSPDFEVRGWVEEGVLVSQSEWEAVRTKLATAAKKEAAEASKYGKVTDLPLKKEKALTMPQFVRINERSDQEHVRVHSMPVPTRADWEKRKESLKTIKNRLLWRRVTDTFFVIGTFHHPLSKNKPVVINGISLRNYIGVKLGCSKVKKAKKLAKRVVSGYSGDQRSLKLKVGDKVKASFIIYKTSSNGVPSAVYFDVCHK